MTLVVFRPLLCAGNKERRRSLYAGSMINVTIEPDEYKNDNHGRELEVVITRKQISFF